MSYHGFASEDEYEDARQEARQEAWEENATECPFCHTLYDEGYHRATRTDPAYVEQDTCPACGMGPDEAKEAADERDDRVLSYGEWEALKAASNADSLTIVQRQARRLELVDAFFNRRDVREVLSDPAKRAYERELGIKPLVPKCPECGDNLSGYGVQSRGCTADECRSM